MQKQFEIQEREGSSKSHGNDVYYKNAMTWIQNVFVKLTFLKFHFHEFLKEPHGLLMRKYWG